MGYQIEFAPAATKQFRKLPRGLQALLGEKIDGLSQEPRPKDAKKLSVPGRDLWRVREGDHRVVYAIRDEILFVLVVKIGHRREVYRRLDRSR